MKRLYAGVYWTLPVNWADFRDLPVEDIDAAAAASKTIRYQRECVRRYVRDEGGELAAEIAFMETRTDRATDAVRDGSLQFLKSIFQIHVLDRGRFIEPQVDPSFEISRR